ncbi:MAG: FHA domain-containing protein [Myxococcota bacterium]|jgi:pSer/pThr/pTyr-binding forkhead associated (FHA) protein|nr:FHA domain-containing protein [Myxococcota bacterium]
MSGPEQGRVFDLAMDAELVMGASKKADITLNDTVASRRHATVRFSAGKLQLTDLQSTNGTFVNGARAESALLELGDQILLGLTVFHVVEAGIGDGPARPVPMPARPRAFRLRIISGSSKGAEIDLPKDRPIVLGASKKVDISLQDDAMSRKHLQLMVTPAGLLVEDLGSTNGTFINAERMTKPMTLLGDDRILIGKTILQVIEF